MSFLPCRLIKIFFSLSKRCKTRTCIFNQAINHCSLNFNALCFCLEIIFLSVLTYEIDSIHITNSKYGYNFRTLILERMDVDVSTQAGEGKDFGDNFLWSLWEQDMSASVTSLLHQSRSFDGCSLLNMLNCLSEIISKCCDFSNSCLFSLCFILHKKFV